MIYDGEYLKKKKEILKILKQTSVSFLSNVYKYTDTHPHNNDHKFSSHILHMNQSIWKKIVDNNNL